MKKFIIVVVSIIYSFLSANLLFAATYNQSDLTGTWQIHEIKTGSSNKWIRMVAAFDSSGSLTAASSCLDSNGDTTCPAAGSITATINENGVVTISGAGTTDTDTHYTMAANKKLMAGTGTNGTSYFMNIMQKAGASYTPGNVASQNLVYHQLRVGKDDTWIRGEGYTDASGVLWISEINALGTNNPVTNMGVTVSVDANGVVTAPGVTNFHGFLSDDLKTIVATHGDATEGYHLMIIQITGQIYPVGTLPAGTSTAHMLGTGAAAFWIHYANMVNSSGVMKFSQWTGSNGSTAPAEPMTGYLEALGTIMIDGNPTYHGQVSHDGTFTVGTQTKQIGPSSYVYMLNVAARSASDFTFDVANVYYSDAVRTINNYDFSAGGRSGDFITIPAAFVTTTDGLDYAYGLFPGSENLSLGWDGPVAGSVATVGTLRGDDNGAAIIATTTDPDPLTAQTAWDYKIRLQNFGVTDNVSDRIVYVGMGSDVSGDQPTIQVWWLADGNLGLRAVIGEDDDPLWITPTPVLLGLQLPASTVLDLRVENTGSAINFFYTLNGGSETLIGTFGSGDGYVANNYKGFPALFPFVNLEIEDPFEVYSFHQNNTYGNRYYANVMVDDPDAIYNNVYAEITNGCGTLTSTALNYSNARWDLPEGVFLSETNMPVCYPIFKITADPDSTPGNGNEIVVHRAINHYVADFATNLQPAGTITGPPTFSWTGIAGAERYWVQISESLDNPYPFIWGEGVDAPTTTIDYSGPALTRGTTYYYAVNSNIGNGSSIAEGSFTYLPPISLYAHFTDSGIWQWSGSDWNQLTASNPTSMVASGTTLYGTFGSNGIWQWNGTDWNQLTTSNPEAIIVSGTTLYGDFGGNGVWKWESSSWNQLTASNPTSMVASGTSLYGTFGSNGIWQWNGSAWSQLTPSNPEAIVVSGTTLYGDFGENGVWKWESSSWNQLTASNPVNMLASGTTLYGTFGSNGIWEWNGSAWSQLTPSNPEAIVASGSTLYGDFGSGGIWQWTGSSWSQISANNPVNMVTGN
ncbi:hypothetical protein DS62_12860 [Smithella sp. SC_K08D17]|nr:hypothetical protein KD27_01130 [Smithella sp. D17]KIE18217.1 hypothetical protein DS62_12860 [Smithella sp. SC_K08D17]